MKIISLINFLISAVNSWDLSHFGVSENYYVSSIAIYRTKAFLALPRSVCHNNIRYPTVIEMPWMGDHVYSTPNVKNVWHKILDYQQWGDCENIQDAVSLDIEPKKPKLWILDKGNDACPPKILSYNLFYNNIAESSELTGIPGELLNTIVIDMEHGEFGYRAYVGNAGDNTLLIFSLKELKWCRLSLLQTTYPFWSVYADFLAVSKTDPILYITGKDSKELFSLNLQNIRNSEGPLAWEAEDFFTEANVTFLGYKLGISRGLETDYKSGLSYFMVRDYAIVRWLTGLPLEAEYHNVLAQSYEEFPYVSELFNGPQNGLWALINPLSPEECTEVNNTITENIPKLESRVVKVLKYNKFFDDISNRARF